MHKYLKKKHSVSTITIAIILISSLIILFSGLLLFSKSNGNGGNWILAVVLPGVILLIISVITLWGSSQTDRDNSPESAIHQEADVHENLIRDLQNEKKYFSKILSHDLRSPLSSIVLLTSYLKAKIDHAESIRYLELIEQSARKELDMMATLLSIMRIDSLKQEKTETVLLKNLAESVIREGEAHLSQKQINSSIHIPSNLSVLTDPEPFKLLFKNVIHHAIHYSDPGQLMEIKTREEDNRVLIEIEIISSRLKNEGVQNLFSSDQLEQDGVKSFPETIDLYFCRKLIRHHQDGTIHVQTDENGPACRFILTLTRQAPQSTA